MDSGGKHRFFSTATVVAVFVLLFLAFILTGKESTAQNQRPSLRDPYAHSYILFPYTPGEEYQKPAPLLTVAEEGIRCLQPLLSGWESTGRQEPVLPDYLIAEAEAAAAKILSHGGSVVFPFITDAHCGYYTDPENTAVALLGQLLNQIGTRVPYTFVANGGDFSTGAWNTTRELTFSHVDAYEALVSLSDESVPYVWAIGNHDDAPYQETQYRLTQQDTYSMIGERNIRNGLRCPEGCNYGYLDLEDQKLRVIVLDTDDKREWGTLQVGAGQPGPDYLNAHNISGAQLAWLADTALNFREKDDPGQWSIIVISHVPLNVSGWYSDVTGGAGGVHSTANAASILRAYKRGTSGSLTHNGIRVNYDFSGEDDRAEIICMIHGHLHQFTSQQINGILSIGCPNAMDGREKRSIDGIVYAKTSETADATSFCILTVDTENRKIYADAVGAGFDREFSY